jgi:MFS transporter, PPP family, 3-phenylpropionic acid transporter
MVSRRWRARSERSPRFITNPDVSPGFRLALFLASIFGAGAVATYMPLWFADQGLSPTAIGQVLGFASLFRVMAGPGWGTLADRIGRRRPVMVAAASVAAMMSLTFIAARGFFPVLVVAAFQGLASSALGPLSDSLALALARQGKMEYGPVRSAGSISYMIVTAAAGQGLALMGSVVAPVFQALGYGVAAMFARLLPEAEVPPSSAHPFGGIRLLSTRSFLLTVSCTALIQGSHAAYYGFAALTWKAQGIGDRTIGLLFAEAIIAEILLFLRGRRIVEWLGPAGLTACASVAAVIRWSAIAAAPSLPVLFALQPLHAATFAMQHLSAMVLLSRYVAPERAATAQALHSALGYGAPTGLMMLLTGSLYARFGGYAFLAMAVCGGAALVVVPSIWRMTRSTAADHEPAQAT